MSGRDALHALLDVARVTAWIVIVLIVIAGGQWLLRVVAG